MGIKPVALCLCMFFLLPLLFFFFQSCVVIQSSLDQRLCSYQKGRATRGQSSHWLYCLLARALSLILALFPLFYRLYIHRQPVNKCSSCLIMWTCRGDANLSIERNTAQRLKMGWDSTVCSHPFSPMRKFAVH